MLTRTLLLLLSTIASAAPRCDLPNSMVPEVLRFLDGAIYNHPRTGPLVVEYATRGDTLVLYVPSVSVVIGGSQEEVVGLFYYYPNRPARKGWGSLTNKAGGVRDPLELFNRSIEGNTGCREQVKPEPRSSTQGQSGVMIEMPKRWKARIAALNREFPECSMRPLPPEPRLCVPLDRKEFCRVEWDWKDVLPVPWAPSPSSPLKQSIMQAIVRAVALRMSEHPGRSQILVHDFNVNDEGTAGAVVTRAGSIVQRFSVRIDKNDQCLAEVDALMGPGCSPCTDEMLSIDAKTRREMLKVYPLDK